jgi:hypothetical protein
LRAVRAIRTGSGPWWRRWVCPTASVTGPRSCPAASSSGSLWLVPQFVLAWIVLFSLIPMLHAGSAAPIVWLVLLDLALAYIAFGRFRDRGLWEWAPVLAGRAFQLLMGENVLRGGPRTDRANETNPVLNGSAGRLRWTRLDDGRGSAVGVVYNPKEKSYAATLQVRAGSFSLLDSGTQDARVDGWGRLMAGLTTYNSRLIRMAVYERTIPDSSDAVQRHFDRTVEAVDATPDRRRQYVIGAYQQLINEAAPTAQRHESFITLVMSAKKAGKEIRRSGGGEAGAMAVLFQELRAFETSVKRVGLVSEGWLNPRELAAVVRTQYDPASVDVIDQRGRGELASLVGGRRVEMAAGVDPSTAGPIASHAANDHYRTDSAFARVFWCSGLPRIAMAAAFHSPMILETTYRRTMTMILEPVPSRKAEAQLNRKQLREGGDQLIRDKFGKATTMRDQQAETETERKLGELLAGHGYIRMVLLVAISADDIEGLEEATGEIQTLANLSRLDLRTLYAQQSAAFAAACLPLGLGVVA